MAQTPTVQTYCSRCNQPITFDFGTGQAACFRCGPAEPSRRKEAVRSASARREAPPREKDAKDHPRQNAMIVRVEGRESQGNLRAHVEPVRAAEFPIPIVADETVVVNRAGYFTAAQKKVIVQALTWHLVQGAFILVIWVSLLVLSSRTGFGMWAGLASLPVAALLFPLMFRPVHEIVMGKPAMQEGTITTRDMVTEGGVIRVIAVINNVELETTESEMLRVQKQRRYRVYYAPIARRLMSFEPI